MIELLKRQLQLLERSGSATAVLAIDDQVCAAARDAGPDDVVARAARLVSSGIVELAGDRPSERGRYWVNVGLQLLRSGEACRASEEGDTR